MTQYAVAVFGKEVGDVLVTTIEACTEEQAIARGNILAPGGYLVGDVQELSELTRGTD